MGLFDYFFGSRAASISDPDQLRQALFEAALSGNQRQLERLCGANREAIVNHFPAWQKVPESLRTDPPAMQRYVQGMVAIAEVFANRLGTPTLLQRLMGTSESNPLIRWQDQLTQARQLMSELRYAEARDLLTDLLIDVRGLQGSGVDSYLPITLGCLGECYFQTREAEKAIPHLEEALRLCQKTGDGEGVVAYVGSLYEVQRYLGQPEPAARYAEQLADALEKQGQPVDATRYRKQAAIVRAGEPLNRVVAIVDNVRQELAEVTEVEGKHIQFVFERNRLTLRPAVEHARRGEERGSAGRYEEALAAFREAAQADPFDPHARYQEGFTLLQLRRYAEAVECYQATEALAPGWFHSHSDLWLAEQLALGKVDHATLVGLHVLEDGPQPPTEKAHLAEQLLARVPDLAPLHLLHGKNLASLGRRAEARAAYREGLECAEEPDVKTRLLVELGVLVDDLSERTALLQQAATLSGNLVAAATAVLALKVGPSTR